MVRTFLLTTIIALYLWPSAAHALTISEIAYDLPGTDSKREWIELYNEADLSVDLTGHLFFDGSYHRLAWLPEQSLTLQSGQFLILAADRTTFLAEHPDFSSEVVDTTMSLPNYQSERTDPIELTVTDKDRSAIAAAHYLPTKQGSTGHTLERDSTDQWHDSGTVGGTPGQSYRQTDSAPPAAAVHFSEVMNNPVGADSDHEWIELSNADASVASLGGWSVVRLDPDGSVIDRQEIEPSFTIAGAGYGLISLSGLTLTNGDLILSLLNSAGQSIEQIALPPAKHEGWSWAIANGQWDWTSEPSPNFANRITQPSPSPSPIVKSPKPSPTSASSFPKGSPTPSTVSRPSPPLKPTVSPSPSIRLALTKVGTTRPSSSPRPTSPLARSAQARTSLTPSPLQGSQASAYRTLPPLAVQASRKWPISHIILGLVGLGLVGAIVRYLTKRYQERRQSDQYIA